MIIGICDDERAFAELLGRKLRDSMKNRGLFDYEIVTFTNSTALLDNITELDILFLDVEMEETNSGIRIKNYIASLEADIRLVFVTSHCEMTEEAFGRNVYAFIQKRDIETRLDAVLEDVLKEYDLELLEMEDVNGIFYRIRASQIKYIEVMDKYTQVYLEKVGILTFRQSLKEWWNWLPAGRFGRASRYCIVNFRYLRGSVHKWNLTVGDKRIDVLKSRKRAFKEAYQQYMRKK